MVGPSGPTRRHACNRRRRKRRGQPDAWANMGEFWQRMERGCCFRTPQFFPRARPAATRSRDRVSLRSQAGPHAGAASRHPCHYTLAPGLIQLASGAAGVCLCLRYVLGVEERVCQAGVPAQWSADSPWFRARAGEDPGGNWAGGASRATTTTNNHSNNSTGRVHVACAFWLLKFKGAGTTVPSILCNASSPCGAAKRGAASIRD